MAVQVVVVMAVQVVVVMAVQVVVVAEAAAVGAGVMEILSFRSLCRLDK